MEQSAPHDHGATPIGGDGQASPPVDAGGHDENATVQLQFIKEKLETTVLA